MKYLTPHFILVIDIRAAPPFLIKTSNWIIIYFLYPIFGPYDRKVLALINKKVMALMIKKSDGPYNQKRDSP